MSNEKKVFVTVIRRPTVETLRNIAHGYKMQVKALRAKVARQEEAAPFNGIRGLETVKVKP